MKRFLATVLAVVLLTTTAATGVVPVQAADDATSKYVTLDGDWNFKLYRTYAQMYQYFAYYPDLAAGTWTDAGAAVKPDAATWQGWDVIQMPADNPETGGLLDDTTFPTWSEAWVCKNFELPANFTTEDTVTLLLGIIDDMDVVYINGQLVAASGFVDGNGAATTNISETGGFDYTNEDPAQRVQFGKSYWEIQREYTIPTEVLNLGGTNEICIRVYNNNSFGGFYSGNIFALCGNDLAVRALKGLPTKKTVSSAVTGAVSAQNGALAAGNLNAYAATIAEDYHNDADNKADKVAQVQAMMAAYTDLKVTDTDAAVYRDDEGNYWYSANRTIIGTKDDVVETISEEAVELCFEVSKGTALERGNWNRCYPASYDSALFGEALTYSVYLPPSYYENPEATYPTVWLLHGRASSSTSYRDVDDIGAFMDEQIASGNLTEMIVIMPDSGKYAFYTDSELTSGDKDNTGPWRTQLVDELRAEVEGTYRTINDAKFRGLTGNSMGGYGAMVVGTTNPDVYSSVGVHMGYLPEDALISLKGLSEEELAKFDFYLDCGLQDTTVYPEGTIAVHDYLESVDKDHGYSLRDGGHNSAFYMSGMAASMKMHSDHFVANAQAEEQPGTGTVIRFTDVAETDWFSAAVEWAVANDITSGTTTTTFGPDVNCTRGQIVTFLSKMDGNPAPKGTEMPFSDVDKDAYYYNAVLWAAENNIVSGYDGIFAPNDPITREQLACILFNYAKFKGYDVSVGEDTNILSYTDALDISDWAYTALQWACGAGVMSGYDGSLDPGGQATRAHVVQMLKNFNDGAAQ